MRTQAQMGQHASQGALALGAGVRAAALVLDGRAQDWGNGAPVFDSSRYCSAFGRSLFLSHARGFPSGQRIGRSSLAASAPGRPLSRRDTSLAGNLGSSARALPHFLFSSPVLDLPFGRAKRHYYGEARRVDAEEMDRAREAVAKLRAARHASNLNRSLAYLRAADPDMYGPAIDGIERSLAAAGVLDSAVAEATAADPVRPFGQRTPQPSDD